MAKPHSVPQEVPDVSRNKFIWPLIIFIGALTYFVVTVSPTALQIQGTLAPTCSDNVNKRLGYACSNPQDEDNPSSALLFESARAENQFLVLEGFPVLKVLNEGQHQVKPRNKNIITLDIEVSIYEVDSDNNFVSSIIDRAHKKIDYDCVKGDKFNECDPTPLAELTGLKGSNYLFVTRFVNVDSLRNQKVDDVRLALVTSNPKFQLAIRYFKWVLFIFSSLSLLIYKLSLNDDFNDDIAKEQKVVGYLAIILLILTQPIINMDYSQTYVLVAAIIASAQCSILIYFWLICLERLSYDEGVVSGTSRFLAQVVSLGSFGALVLAYQKLGHDQISSPLVDWKSDTALEFGSIWPLYGALLLVSLWTLIGVIRVVPKFSRLDWRDSTAFTFTLCYIIYYSVFVGSGNYQFVNPKGSRAIMLYGITTLYTLILQVIYIPYDFESRIEEQIGDEENVQRKVGYGNLNESVGVGEVELSNPNGEEGEDEEELEEEEEVQ